MFFTSKTQPAGFTDVWFGWELKGLCPLESGITVGEAVRQAARFVRTLYTPEVEVAYELVAQSRHAGNLGPNLSLRARVSHHNGATALDKAQEVAKGIASGLALWERLHWLPLDETRYKQLFEGFAAGSVWEISRRTELLEFAPDTYTPASGRHALSICPFPPAPNPFCRIMHILNHCREQVRFSVAITPARFSEREFKFLNAQRLAQKADEEEVSPLHPYVTMGVMGNTATSALQMDSCFLLRIYTASVEPIPAIVVNSLGCALAAPSIPGDSAGGFKIQLLEDPAEKRIAEDNLENLRFTLTPFQTGAVYGRLPMIVPTMEAAAVFRFPTTLCPGLERVRRPAPFTGAPAAEGTLIGFASDIASDRAEIRLSPESRLRHLFIAGQTGTGKSSLLLSLALQDIKSGQGVAVLDPHGDLYSRLLANIPAERLKDVITFDCSTEDPGHFNLLEHYSDCERDKIVEHFLDIFGQLFNLDVAGGPVFETYFRSALLLVMTTSTPKLEDFVRFFWDHDFREQCIERCKDTFLTETWEKLISTAGGDLALANIAPYITAKLSPFLLNQRTRKIISCNDSTLDFDAIVRERKILLVNLAKGTIGKPAASFVGMLFVEKILRSALQPGNKACAGKNFYMYADEFQNLATPGASEILSEARKFNFGAVLAHQYLGQLPPGVLKSVLGNAGSLIIMRVGLEDATLLEDYFQSAFSKADLLSLPVGVAAASILSAAGDKPGPFMLSTSNGLALTSGAAAARQEKPETAEMPAVCAKKPAKRSRGDLRPLKTEPKVDGR